MIAACPSRFEEDCPPLGWCASPTQAGVVLLDGLGSWGTGAEAAAWTRERFAHDFERAPPTSPRAFTEALSRALTELPLSITAEWGGWSFSAAAVLVDGPCWHVASLGRHAIVAVGPRGATTLAAPQRPLDALVASGQVTPAEAEHHSIAHFLQGPFVGDAEFVWLPPIDDAEVDCVLVGDPALPRLLALGRVDPSAGPLGLRDAIEQHGGRSAATAIVTR